MGTAEIPQHLFPNRFADAVGPGSDGADRDRCRCVGYSAETRPATVSFHGELQDFEAAEGTYVNLGDRALR